MNGEALKKLALHVHDIVVERIYTTKGTRYDADLERAKDLVDLARMVALLHPFVDGNKRTAYIIWRLSQSGWRKSNLPEEWLDHYIDMIFTDEEGWLNILAQI